MEGNKIGISIYVDIILNHSIINVNLAQGIRDKG